MTDTAKKPGTAAKRAAAPPAAERHLRITLVRSLIGYSRAQRETAKGLGLRKIGSRVVRRETPEILGMVRKISHVLNVETVEKP